MPKYSELHLSNNKPPPRRHMTTFDFQHRVTLSHDFQELHDELIKHCLANDCRITLDDIKAITQYVKPGFDSDKVVQLIRYGDYGNIFFEKFPSVFFLLY
ncbi:MAG: hypothetical protein ACFFD4_15930 [Candidatus Odinarchaeota archaeon]